MPIQKCFRGLKPDPPTIHTASVAMRIAERIVKAVNLDDFYWCPEELPERIEDVATEIVRNGEPTTVFFRLHRKQAPISDSGEKSTSPYGWEGIDEHCRAIATAIATEELASAMQQYRRDYGWKGEGEKRWVRTGVSRRRFIGFRKA